MYQGIKHNSVIVVGAGYSIKEHRSAILKFIKDHHCVVIGVNAMTGLCIPDYHLWTNKKQYTNRGSCIDPKKSIMMFGSGMPQSVIRKHLTTGKYMSVNYVDNTDLWSMSEKCICGNFRTAGILAIAIAGLMEPKEFFVVGMDGYTFRSKKSIDKKLTSQHCYGKGKTDDATWEECLQKDDLMYTGLDKLSEFFKFRIITPTKFDRHYDGAVLGI